MKFLFPLACTFMVLTAACASQQKNTGRHSQPKSKREKSIGNLNKVHSFGNIYLAGQPDEATLSQLKDQDFQAVINIREPSENPEFAEQSLVEKQGMKYYNIPLKKRSDITDSWVASIQSAIEENKGSKVLLHCEEGDRAGVWLGSYLVKEKRSSKESAEAMMESFDLVNPYWIKSLRKYTSKKENY
jgi:protein tyrosine phosphatase (PTP) superfamily phosphohydrolase (DUF442 family)